MDANNTQGRRTDFPNEESTIEKSDSGNPAVPRPATAAERAVRKASDRAAAGSRAKFVTRPAIFSKEELEDKNKEEPRVLLHGIDTLDLGLYVQWNHYWPKVTAELAKGKRNASRTQGIPFGDGRCVILPGGKPPIYAWHLVYPQFHLFLSKHQQPKQKTPNAYISFNSETLWSLGITGALAEVEQQLRALDGVLLEHVVSRCDPCVDLIIPGGLTYNFIQKHRVPTNRKTHVYEDQQLETCYVGAAKADIQLRIYDKSLEINQQSQKNWFLDLWQLEECENVWRIEYQLRREILRQFDIKTISQLEQQLPGIWQYLTNEWFSLRLPDNENASRRSIHPLWRLVQSAAEQFGQVVDVRREITTGANDPAWYLSHIAGCLMGYAVSQGIPTLDAAIEQLLPGIRDYFREKDFSEIYHVRSIKAGLIPEKKGVA